jgi:hypothetical protein
VLKALREALPSGTAWLALHAELLPPGPAWLALHKELAPARPDPDLLEAAWNGTPEDYRDTRADGTRVVLYLDARSGATISAPLSTLPVEDLWERARHAARDLARGGRLVAFLRDRADAARAQGDPGKRLASLLNRTANAIERQRLPANKRVEALRRASTQLGAHYPATEAVFRDPRPDLMEQFHRWELRADLGFDAGRRVKILAGDHAGLVGVVALPLDHRLPADRRYIQLDALPGEPSQKVDIGVTDLVAEEFA